MRGSAGPVSHAPLFTSLPRGGCLSSREAVLVLRRPPHYLRHFREAVVSVRERQCWSCVARPIIYDTSAGRLSQFARGSAGPGPPAPLFTSLSWGSGCPPAGVAKCTVKHVRFDTFDVNFSIVLVFPVEKRQTDREPTQKGSAPHGVFDGSTQPPK